jgi:hypothetical protein
MKRALFAVPAAGLLLLAASCSLFTSAGEQTTQDRTIQGVTAVHLLTSGDLTITAGQTQALTVTAGANQLVGLTTQVIDGTLILDRKSTSADSGEISYALTVPPVTSIEISGSGSVAGVGVLAGDAQVIVSGSGSATQPGLVLSSVVVDLTGSGNVQLAGTAETSRITIDGSGQYDGSDLVTAETDVDSSGSGDAAVHATQRLGARASGSGSITYTGNPATVDQDASGSGDITAG